MGIIDFIYPKRCPMCMDSLPPGPYYICAPCEKKIRRVQQPFCYRCGRPLRDETEELCFLCMENTPPFTKGISWAEYSSKYIKRLMSQIKYHDGRQLLDYPCMDMGKQYEKVVSSWNAEALIPVPLHQSRRKKRGYNQAEEIAIRLGRQWNLPVDTSILFRTEKTKAQKELGKNERQQNLYHAFSALPSEKHYKRVILVDDIYTTGSTASACTRRLLEVGISNVYVSTLAIGRDDV